MKKILLIDDRKDEQERLLQRYKINLDEYSTILDNLTGDMAINLFATFNTNDEFLLQYSVWIIHHSMFKKRKPILKKIEKFCHQNGINLVLFTGDNQKIEFNPKKGLLKLSRNDLYRNLKPFLDYNRDVEPQLVILGFGDNWKAALLSNVEDSIEKFLNNVGETISIELFKNEINNLETAVKILDNVKFLDLTGNVSRNEVESLLQDMQDEIKEQMEI